MLTCKQKSYSGNRRYKMSKIQNKNVFKLKMIVKIIQNTVSANSKLLLYRVNFTEIFRKYLDLSKNSSVMVFIHTFLFLSHL